VLLAKQVLALLLVALLVGVSTAAFADPPDPTWIGGYWDDDDFDNAVNAIRTATALKAPTRAHVEFLILACVAHVATPKQIGWRTPPLTVAASRAPPVDSPTHS